METWSDDAFAGYLAAMIDGEGHIERVGTWSVRIRIANTIKPTLDAMAARLGFGRVIEYGGREKLGYQRLFCLEIGNARDVTALFDLCGQFIHMKRDQMEDALSITRRVLADVEATDQRNRGILAAIEAGGRSQAAIAREFGVSPQLVSYLKKGHTWGSVLRGHQARKLTKKFPKVAQQVMRLHSRV
ncbi:MAG: hypothetical protein ABFE07_16890 [Armatimonadia bacterium]